MSIDLTPSPEQAQIVDAMRKVLREQFPAARLRGGGMSGDPPGGDRAGLDTLATLGAWGLGAPETIGGMGLGIVEEVLVYTEFGRHLVAPGALAATLGARLAAALGQPVLARDIVEGRSRVGIANALAPCDTADLRGVPVHLIDAPGTDHLLLWNDTGMALLRTDALHATHGSCMDPSITLQHGTLTESAVVGRLGATHTPLVREAHLLLGAMLLGMAEAARDLAVDYARTREQFGRPIGAFQAVKHRCADMALGTQALRAQLQMAALAEQGAWPDAAFQNDACRMLAARCALDNAAACIQVHGGIGFTAECDAHLFVLRAHVYEQLGGTRGTVQARLAAPSPGGTEREDPCRSH